MGSKKKKNLKKILSSYTTTDSSGKVIRKETRIEKGIREILEKNQYKFLSEFPIYYGKRRKRKVFDFYVWGENEYGEKTWHLLIEAHGSYFHAKELYDGSKSFNRLAPIQKKNVRNDRFKRKIAQKNHIPIVAFWESEINTTPKKVKAKIESIVSWIVENATHLIPEDIHPIYEYKAKPGDGLVVKKKRIDYKKFKSRLAKK